MPCHGLCSGQEFLFPIPKAPKHKGVDIPKMMTHESLLTSFFFCFYRTNRGKREKRLKTNDCNTMAYDIIFSQMCFTKLYYKSPSAKLGMKAEHRGKVSHHYFTTISLVAYELWLSPQYSNTHLTKAGTFTLVCPGYIHQFSYTGSLHAVTPSFPTAFQVLQVFISPLLLSCTSSILIHLKRIWVITQDLS